MSANLYVSYLRPAASARGPSGGGPASQRAAVERHLGRRGRLVAEVVGSAADPDRPDLSEALALCRRHGATLLVAELGAAGDDPDFLRELSRALRALDLRFAAIDRPEASERTLGIMAAVAGAEDRLGVICTPETMARRREFYARFTAERRDRTAAGDRAGPEPDPAGPRPPPPNGGRNATRSRERAQEVAPILTAIRAAGAETLEQVANALNGLGIPSARGNRWYPMQVTRIEKRLGSAI